MQITRKSPWSKKINTMEINVTQDQINSWEDGELIQNAMPELEPAEREFIVNGITPDDWFDIFVDDVL
jgi:hypothetical protein